MIRLGPFRLVQPLGAGGMGVVWQGEHTATAQPVAVKLLTREATTDPLALEEFRAEIRAAARLHHPAIVALYDHGTVATDHPPLVAGTPYFAMELVAGSNLTEHCGALGWSFGRQVLLRVLDGLAHAHARGVIHRDVKPGNILVSGDFETVKITDFGVAHVTHEDSSDRSLISGTPAYMAPEQLDGRWREFGPWTDLYAVGCLAWALFTGKPPFWGRISLDETYYAHHLDDPPPFEPMVDVPDAAEGWMRRLLEKRPRDRFQCAADAAWALLQMPRTGGRRTIRPSLGDSAAQPTDRWARTLTDLEYAAATTDAAASGEGDDPSPTDPCPPMTASWRSSAPDSRVAPLVGAGLRLFPWRQIPVVGRVPERDRLWQALRAVTEAGAPRAVVLRGATGMGKTRLAEWLCERASEVGAARVMVLGRGPGLTQDLAHHLRCTGLAVDKLPARLTAALRTDGPVNESDVAALGALLSPRARYTSAEGTVVRIRSDAERRTIATRLLARMARRRPVVLFLEDLHDGLEALQLAQAVLELEARPPILVLGAVRDESLVPGGPEAVALEQFLARSEADEIRLDPLAAGETRALLSGLLRLERDLAQEVESRTGGNPQFAMQLIGSWVQRGQLRSGPHGFHLTEDATAELPNDLHGVWTERIQRVLRERSEADGRSLQLAAAGGRRVIDARWRAACRELNVAPATDLLERLFVERLAIPDRDRPGRGWSFAHSMLCESLQRSAKEAGVWQSLHAAYVRVLRPSSDEHPGALGHHLLEAGRPAEALEPMARGADRAIESGDYPGARRLLAQWHRARRGAAIGDADPRAAAGRIQHSRLWYKLGRYRDAADEAARVLEAGDRGELRIRALLARARAVRELGLLDEALTSLRTAERLAIEGEHLSLQPFCRRRMGQVRIDRGEVDEAEAAFAAALSGLESQGHGDGFEAAACWQGLATVAHKRGDLEQATDRIEAARKRFERVGARGGVAAAVLLLGEIHRQRGHLPAAASAYEAALNLYGETGDANAIFARLNLALVETQRADFETAEARLDAVQHTARRQGRPSLEAVTHVALAVCAAAARDWTAYDEALNCASTLLKACNFVGVDIAWCAGRAGELARAHDQPHRARTALDLSLLQWTSLGRPEADRVRRLLDAPKS